MTETGGAGEVTEWLDRWAEGDSAALERLTPLVYNQLRAIADGLLQNERSGHTLQATALVNETFRKLLDLHRVALNDRVHFYTFAARLMRRILIDHARRWRAEKRGMRLDRVPLNDELAWVDRRAEESLDLSTALEELECLDAQKSKVVELRYFLGCTVPEIAVLLNVSPSTIDRALRFSLAWLHDRLHGRSA